VPGVTGNVNVRVAPLNPVAGGLLVPFKYFQPRSFVTAAPVANNPTQSNGWPGPLAIVVVIGAPRAPVVGALGVILGARIVMGALVAPTPFVLFR
jgi:hypothetical protein